MPEFKVGDVVEIVYNTVSRDSTTKLTSYPEYAHMQMGARFEVEQVIDLYVIDLFEIKLKGYTHMWSDKRFKLYQPSVHVGGYFD